MTLIRDIYHRQDYLEVGTPNIFSVDLWKISGHYDQYFENMFPMEVDSQVYSLKPMNCPCHCLIFKNTNHSYRDLPLRLADFGVLHRNEASGALTGLTRVRKFCQDDAHIFCRGDQILPEIKNVLQFIQSIYNLFGFTYSIFLSTRPESYMGSPELWDRAEKTLSSALEEQKIEYKVNPGDGAFYGPKIDIRLKDSLGREHQCGTIQLDFQLPLKFELQYRDEKNELQIPVMIHRAVLGSIERMMAILIEHYQGKVAVLVISSTSSSYLSNQE